MCNTCPHIFIYLLLALLENRAYPDKVISAPEGWIEFIYVCRSICLICQNSSLGHAKDAMVWQRYNICWSRSLFEAALCQYV